ncbi:MAG: heme biosynthesis protein HemY, partial [Methylocystaceae bacterium]|nr:heme biosynthesis protein HemY [Methylocystaceae bacterium]
YFEAALSIEETPFVCEQLGALLLQLGQTEESARMFQRGLQIALSQ